MLRFPPEAFDFLSRLPGLDPGEEGFLSDTHTQVWLLFGGQSTLEVVDFHGRFESGFQGGHPVAEANDFRLQPQS